MEKHLVSTPCIGITNVVLADQGSKVDQTALVDRDFKADLMAPIDQGFKADQTALIDQGFKADLMSPIDRDSKNELKNLIQGKIANVSLDNKFRSFNEVA